MDTFFVRKQIVLGVILFGCIEMGVLLIRALAH
jgi:hypothetical protein